MPKNPFKVGDLADRKDRSLDPRPVAEVKGGMIRLEIGDVPDCWVRADWYDRIVPLDALATAMTIDQHERDAEAALLDGEGS